MATGYFPVKLAAAGSLDLPLIQQPGGRCTNNRIGRIRPHVGPFFNYVNSTDCSFSTTDENDVNSGTILRGTDPTVSATAPSRAVAPEAQQMPRQQHFAYVAACLHCSSHRTRPVNPPPQIADRRRRHRRHDG